MAKTRRKKGLGSLRERPAGSGKWCFEFNGMAHHPTELGLSGHVKFSATIIAATRVLAERIAATRVADRLEANAHPERFPFTPWQFFKDREGAVLRGKNDPMYRVNLVQGIERFADWLVKHYGPLPILQVRPQHAMEYMQYATKTWTWRKATVRRNCTYLSQLWEVLVDEDRIPSDGNFWRTFPRRIYRAAHLATVKGNDSRMKVIMTWAESDVAVASMPAKSRFLVDFLRHVPLRRTAFIRASVSDLRHDDDRDNWVLDVPVSKNKQPRTIPIPAVLHAELLAWRAQFCKRHVGDAAPLFGDWADEKGWQRLYNHWQRAQVGIQVKHPMSLHNLRDLFMVAKRDAGVPHAVSAYLMGNDPRTAQKHYGYHVVADDAAKAMGC